MWLCGGVGVLSEGEQCVVSGAAITVEVFVLVKEACTVGGIVVLV